MRLPAPSDCGTWPASAVSEPTIIPEISLPSKVRSIVPVSETVGVDPEVKAARIVNTLVPAT